MKKQKPPKFTVGDSIEYYRRGICYPGVIRQDVGILKGTGRRYRITKDADRCLVDFDFTVAERWLCRAEWGQEMKTAKVLIQTIQLECPYCHELIKASNGATSIHANDKAETWASIASFKQICQNCLEPYWLPVNPFRRKVGK